MGWRCPRSHLCHPPQHQQKEKPPGPQGCTFSGSQPSYGSGGRREGREGPNSLTGTVAVTRAGGPLGTPSLCRLFLGTTSTQPFQSHCPSRTPPPHPKSETKTCPALHEPMHGPSTRALTPLPGPAAPSGEAFPQKCLFLEASALELRGAGAGKGRFLPTWPLEIGGLPACFTSPHPFKSKRFCLFSQKKKKKS